MTVTIQNDRDVMLQAAQRSLDPRANKYLVLAVDTPFFHVSTTGTPFPATINIQATPVNIGGGTITFSVPSGVTLGGTGNTRTLNFSDMQIDSAVITASITDLGQTYTTTQVIAKVQDGQAGATGPAGAQYATGYLYKWSSSQPALPTGTSTLSWNVGANTSYVGSDGWYTSVPANPGTPGIQLWVAQKQASAPSGTQTTDITYSAGATLSAISQNGATGTPGVKTARAVAYQWGNGAAPTATGSAQYTWATGSYDNVPATGWSKTKPAAPAVGYTLFEAGVSLVDSTGATTSSIDWSTAAIASVGYLGVDGASSAIAYVLVDGSSLNSTPSTYTSAGNALPATGTWGETRAWQSTPPATAAGQSVFQSNGVYNPLSNTTVWSVPYLSNWRVGSLSALTVNTGGLNVSGTISSSNNNFVVNADGSATMKALTIQDASGNTILTSSGGKLNISYAPDATLNSGISIGANGTLAGAGGGQVTITGLGYTGALNATANSVLQGTLAARPTGANGDFYFATDNSTLYQKISGSWVAASTYGATIGSNLSGQITSTNISGLIASGAIGSTYIADLAASKITSGTLVSGVIYSGSISASQITTGTLSADKVTGGTLTGASISIAGTPGNTVFSVTNGGSVVGYRSLNGYNISAGYLYDPSSPAVKGTGYGAEGVFGYNSSGNSGGHGVRGQAAITGNTSSITSGVVGGANGYDFYADGAGTNYGPFTGSHDALIVSDTVLTPGDIVYDVTIVSRNGMSNTIAEVKPSSQAKQKAVVGVYVSTLGPLTSSIPSVFYERTVTSVHDDYGNVTEVQNITYTDDYERVKSSYTVIAMNALGEGQINVCGRGGDIEAGDFICASDISGKGMKQDDDLLHSYTVAKSRESVTFASPDEVKTIACIYVCG